MCAASCYGSISCWSEEDSLMQGCGAETIFFRSDSRSGSDFQKVLAPAPATALELPVITDFMLNRTFFMFFMKENRPNSHVRSYSI
jgi:hypothetical protein